MTTQHCSERISDDYFGGHQCTKPVKVVRDGKPYCTIHDPVRVAEKRKAEKAEYDAKWAAIHEKYHREAVINRICDGIPVFILESHAPDIRKYIEGLS